MVSMLFDIPFYDMIDGIREDGPTRFEYDRKYPNII